MSLFTKVVAIVGRNGVVTEVTKKSETLNKVKVEATIQVASDDYRKQTYEINKDKPE